ncbi:MAG: TetR/AcrR family transcriptional regulator [Planctomycetes bacterium]|nr:TetR/AcrR family transcriptional regulator [Planctomycetota bacterium]
MDEIKKDTYARLIESAGMLFAQKGFKATTIREICEHADANIASVNYYFRDKKKLFLEVLLFVINISQEKFPVERIYEEFESSKEKLHEFIKDYVMRRFSPEFPRWFGRLINRDTIFEHPEVHDLIMQEFSKFSLFLRPFLSSVLDVNMDSIVVKLCETNILGNVRFLTGPIFLKHHPLFNKEITSDLLDKLVDFVADYTFAGICEIRDRLQQEGNDKYEI